MGSINNTAGIIGGNGRRRPMDFYPTPDECTIALLDFLQIPKGETIWECAAGGGDMARVFRAYGYKTITTDVLTGTDFLTAPDEECDWIITNPPFSLSDRFIIRAAGAGRPFAFLLKSQYWHAARRLPLFEEITPSYILPLTWRPDFTGRKASLMDVCWAVWNGEPGARYIPLRRPERGGEKK